MKKQTQSRRHGSDEIRAQKAIQRIQKIIEKRYPRLAGSAKTRMIIECLIELSEEKKLVACI